MQEVELGNKKEDFEQFKYYGKHIKDNKQCTRLTIVDS